MEITEQHIRQEIRRLIADLTERTPEEISDEASFVEGLELDSLMAMELMVDLDRKFNIEIPEEEFATIRNINEAVASVYRYLHPTVAKTTAS